MHVANFCEAKFSNKNSKLFHKWWKTCNELNEFQMQIDHVLNEDFGGRKRRTWIIKRFYESSSFSVEKLWRKIRGKSRDVLTWSQSL